MGKINPDNRSHEMILLLKKAVETKMKKTFNSFRDFEDAAEWINDGEKFKENKISESSLTNWWSKKELKILPNNSKLSIVARKLGYKDWDDFYEKTIQQFDLTKGFKTINMYEYNNLSIDDVICIGWYPQKYCMLKFLGDYSFKIIESYNLKSPVNRDFKTTGFIHDAIINQFEYPDIIIEPLFDDDPNCELINMGLIPLECLL